MEHNARGGGETITFIVMETPDLTRAADTIVVGRVEALQSVITARGRIFTQVSVLPEELLKGGPAAGTISVRVPGGEVGGQRRVIHGAPSFHIGEEVLLFLSRGADGHLHTRYLAMGKMSVVTAPTPTLRSASIWTPVGMSIWDPSPARPPWRTEWRPGATS